MDWRGGGYDCGGDAERQSRGHDQQQGTAPSPLMDVKATVCRPNTTTGGVVAAGNGRGVLL